MDFMEAVKAMKEGKKVKTSGTIYNHDFVKIVGGYFKYGDESDCSIHPDVFDYDWEVVEEDKDWCLNEHIETDSFLETSARILDVKKTFDLIKKDIDSYDLRSLTKLDLFQIIDKRSGFHA